MTERRQRRWLVAAIVAGVFPLVTLGITASPIPSLAARAWAVGGAPKEADVIVVLGGGATWPGVLLCGSLQRLQQGVWLYKQGYAPRLILSGGGNAHHSAMPAEAEIMRRTALTMGVRPEHIVVEVRSSRTYENGTEVAAIMRREGWRSAVLVTDALHMRRARLVFAHLGIRAYPSPSHTLAIAATTPGQGLAVLEEIAYEVLAIVVYKLQGWV